MPLSEEELRLLEQMERALVEEDPKFASTLRGTTLRQSARRKAILAGVVFVGGIVVLMTGAIKALPVVGILGFLIMLVSATVGPHRAPRPAWRPRRRGPAPAEGGTGQAHRSRRLHRHRRRTRRQAATPASPGQRLVHGPHGGALAPPPRGQRLLTSRDTEPGEHTPGLRHARGRLGVRSLNMAYLASHAMFRFLRPAGEIAPPQPTWSTTPGVGHLLLAGVVGAARATAGGEHRPGQPLGATPGTAA